MHFRKYPAYSYQTSESVSAQFNITSHFSTPLQSEHSLRLCGPADEQLRRGELGASPAAKLREYNLWRRALPTGAATEGKSGGGDME